MDVYVVECDEYDCKHVAGVYSSLELAMAAWPNPTGKWVADQDRGHWDNDARMGSDFRAITRWTVDE